MSTSNIRKIHGFKGYYVDIEGEIYSAWVQHGMGKRFLEPNNLKKIKQFSLPSGHMTLKVKINGKSKTLRPQIAVAKAFLKNNNPKYKIYVCHKDGNPKNNNVNNLYWGTPAENTNDMRKHGTMAIGNQLPQAKLNMHKVKLLRLLRNDFKWTYSKLAKLFNIDYRAVWNAVNGISWKHII